MLFTLYIFHLHEIITRHGAMNHFYADDSQMYKAFRVSSSRDEQRSAFATLSSAIGEVRDWLSANFLKLNEVKTDALLMYSASARNPPERSPVDVGGVPIHPSDVVRNLGVLLDSHLTMDKQIRATCKRAYFHIRRIARIKRFLPTPAVKQLIHAFVISQLDYGNALLAALPDARLEPLQRVQNSAARLITGSRKTDHISPHLRALHWLPIRRRVDYKIAVLTFRCLHQSAPSYLSDLVHPYCPSRSLRSESLHQLVVPSSRLKSFGDRSFSVFAPRLWNTLPLNIRSAQSLSQSKSLLKTYLFRLSYGNM